jgi:zinc/manganese transport system ATP-binding protein
MNVVELDDATITIGGRAVLSNVSFAIRSGEFIGVLGPNGAGKTTLMRAILGLLPPSAGTLRIFGVAPVRGNPAIGYLPQVRTMLPDLRVRGRDFIASSLNGERWGLPSLSRADRVMIEKILDAVGARDLAARPLSNMSGGERQRLLLAQALIGQSKLLLLDEPLINLDARHQEVAIGVVRQAWVERKITVLFSARTQSAARYASTACSISARPGGARHRGRSGDPHRCCHSYGTEIHVVRRRPYFS